MRRSPDLAKQFPCNQQFVGHSAIPHKTELRARKSPVQLPYNQHLRDALGSVANTGLTVCNFHAQVDYNQHFCKHCGSVHSTGFITQLESILTRPNTRKPTIINTSKIQGDTPIFKSWSNHRQSLSARAIPTSLPLPTRVSESRYYGSYRYRKLQPADRDLRRELWTYLEKAATTTNPRSPCARPFPD